MTEWDFDPDGQNSWIKNTYRKCKKTILRKVLGREENDFPVKGSENEEGIIYYEYTLHHKLRAVWARVNGLLYLLNYSKIEEERDAITKLIMDSLREIDKEMNEVGRKLSNRK